MRVGMGYDVHQLVDGRRLIMGGVLIPHEKGLLGHSDADVLIHAIMDALLGAAGLGVIGQHFPDNDMQFKDISSLVLLDRVVQLLKENNLNINNIDATIIAQKPKMQPYFSAMIDNIARVLDISPNLINIKATTTEYLGFEGRGEGIKAIAVCLLL